MDNSDIPDNDKLEWEKFIENPNQYEEPEKDSDIIAEKIKIDLHQMNESQAYKAIIKALNYANTNNIKNISIITGIGKKCEKSQTSYGKLYHQTPKWLDTLKSSQGIESFYRNRKNKGEIIIKLH